MFHSAWILKMPLSFALVVASECDTEEAYERLWLRVTIVTIAVWPGCSGKLRSQVPGPGSGQQSQFLVISWHRKIASQVLLIKTRAAQAQASSWPSRKAASYTFLRSSWFRHLGSRVIVILALQHRDRSKSDQCVLSVGWGVQRSMSVLYRYTQSIMSVITLLYNIKYHSWVRLNLTTSYWWKWWSLPFY